jgi:hypothetical protein
MRWDERQRAMLGAMGLTIWSPPGTVDLAHWRRLAGP